MNLKDMIGFCVLPPECVCHSIFCICSRKPIQRTVCDKVLHYTLQ